MNCKQALIYKDDKMPQNTMFFSIFDFDNTLTQNHTFSAYRLEHWIDKSSTEIQEQGMLNAASNAKKNLSEYFIHDKKNYINAIATYHNNPEFIAGFIAAILNKKLTRIPQKTSYEEAKKIALHYYAVEDCDTPLLICSINALNDLFSQTIADLHGKNEQIDFIRQALVEDGHIAINTPIKYYDDSFENFEHARLVPYLSGHWVNKQDPLLTIIEQFTYKPPVQEEIVEDFLIASEVSTRTSSSNHDSDDLLPASSDETTPSPSLEDDDRSLPRTGSAIPTILQTRSMRVREEDVSPHFFLQLINSPQAKILGMPLLIAGLALFTVGMLSAGDIIDCSTSTSLGTICTGVTIAAIGAHLALGYSFFSPPQNEAKKDNKPSAEMRP